MANPVTYNSGSNPTGALKFGTMSMSVATSLNITGYNWRNGFENNNIWVIYSDTYSQGQSTQGNSVPTIWATPIFTDQGLIDMINVLPARAGQTAFTTLSSAISWLVGEGKYFLSNQNYPMIVTDSLQFFVDAGLSASYPNVGSNWYELLGSLSGSLNNSPVWSNFTSKSFFTFDGADDWVNFANNTSLNSNTITVSSTFNPNSVNQAGFLFEKGYVNTQYALFFENPHFKLRFMFNQGTQDFQIVASSYMSAGNWYNCTVTYDGSVAKMYLNGANILTTTYNGTLPSNNNGERIGSWYNGVDTGYHFSGKIAKTFVYNKALSESEVLQNYYQGPIVTSNLSYLWDASNIVSFQSGNSTTFDLKGSGVNGTLQNGVVYSNNFGGYWSFDGADDRIILTSSPYSIYLGTGSQNVTISAWIRTTSTADGLSANGIISNTNGGPIHTSYEVNGGYQTFWAYPSNIGGWKQFKGTILVNDGQWHMLTWVNNSNQTMDLYVDGVYDITVSPTNVNANYLDVIGSALGTAFNGSIGMVQINYGTAFNAQQVRQQYGATESRFKSFAAYANGGTVTTITQNGIQYRVHTFTSSGTLSVVKAGTVEYLIVAGGGGGGAYAAGAGAGAGGLRWETNYNVTVGNKTVTVGAGGAGSVYTISSAANGNNSVFDSITSNGGGYGGEGWAGQIGGNGGSGGGGGGYDGTQGTFTVAGGTGVAGQGYNGGVGRGISGNRGAGGGGGGAGAQGGDSTTNSGGNGGNGRQISINGTATYYAGGGGGGDYGSANGGQGGLGGGGNVSGGNASGIPGGNGTVNTGGGGGGSRSATSDSWNGGNGGSGIVIIRYPIG